MKKNNEEFKQLVYDLMFGSLDIKRYPIEESKYVKNEFEEGRFCMKAYTEVFEANSRLCERLGVQEDRDAEILITNLLDIAQYLSKKMYDYGVLFSSPSIR